MKPYETHLFWIGQRLSSWSHTLSLAWTVNGTERKCLANYLQTSSDWKTASFQQWQTYRPSFSRKANCSSSFFWNMQDNYAQKTKCCTRQSVPIESTTCPPWTHHLRSSWVFLFEIVWRCVKGVVMGAVVPERFGCSDPLSFGQAQNRNTPLAWNSRVGGGFGTFAQ